MANDLPDRLRSLRIERGDEPRPGRPRWQVALTIAVVAALLGLGSLLARRVFRSAPLEVDVAYARVVAPGEGAGARVLSGAGYVITGENYISVGVRVPGRIEKFLVDEGDRVEEGQELVRLDDRDYRAQQGRAEADLRVARANRKLARAQYGRVKELFDGGVTSQEELDQAKSGAEVAEAEVARADNNLEQARVNLEDTVLRSPVRGVVLAKLKGVGEIAVPGGFAGAGDLLRIADLSELRAELDVGEADLARVHRGQAAEVVPDAYPDRRYRATVVKLHPQVNRQKGTLTVEVRIEDADERLLPDMSARVTFLADAPAPQSGPSVVLIPRSAIVRGETGDSSVWIVTGGRLRRQAVVATSDYGSEVQIREGLDGGEAVVTTPAEGMREGEEVTVRQKTGEV